MITALIIIGAFAAGWLARDVLACRVNAQRGNVIDLTGVRPVRPSPMKPEGRVDRTPW